MHVTTRTATASDLDRIAELTAAQRRRLAGWSPRWWHPSEHADGIHRAWLQHLIGADGPVVRVVEDAGEIIGCAISMPQADRWFVDDLAIADPRRWDDIGPSLFGMIEERPALTCIATLDDQRAVAAHRHGLTTASSYWMREPIPSVDEGRDPRVARVPEVVPDGPAHTFGAAVDPHAEGALVVAGEAGLVIGSPSIAAPPVYDPAGTVCVVDRVVGGDRQALVAATLAAVAERGDVLLTVVCGADDAELEWILAAEGFERTVEVVAWP